MKISILNTYRPEKSRAIKAADALSLPLRMALGGKKVTLQKITSYSVSARVAAIVLLILFTPLLIIGTVSLGVKKAVFVPPVQALSKKEKPHICIEHPVTPVPPNQEKAEKEVLNAYKNKVDDFLITLPTEEARKQAKVLAWMRPFGAEFEELMSLRDVSKNVPRNLAQSSLIEAIKECPKDVLNQAFPSRVMGMQYGSLTPLVYWLKYVEDNNPYRKPVVDAFIAQGADPNVPCHDGYSDIYL